MIAALGLFAGLTALAEPPQLYHQDFFEGPVRADPDDLLLLAGNGLTAEDQVVYQALTDAGHVPPAPLELPAQSTAENGLATVVSAADVPYSLTVRLPMQLKVDQAYALWVRSAGGEWSRPVRINDARPLWFSPAYAFSTGKVATLPRELKVIGRNLQPAPGESTQVRLTGPHRYLLRTVRAGQSAGFIDRYVARAPLPDTLIPGRYRVQLTRDGTNWVDLADQTFEVREDPGPPRPFDISDPRFGGCRPDDDADDTSCIVRAIAAAQRAGGGVIVFGPGTWDLIGSTQNGVTSAEGIIVPRGVQLRGAGDARTVVARHATWNAQRATAAFTLAGSTTVTGFRFRDLQVYAPRDNAGPTLQLGANFLEVASIPKSTAADAVAADITITHNIFDKTMVALGNGGLPLSRLIVTANTFGAYHSAMQLAGDRVNMRWKYAIDDSVIAHNTFKPGSKLDVEGKTGAIASELGAGFRLDFSDNTLDGTSTEYLYSPNDAHGWRAGFFWNLTANVEETLISGNTASCTGDKIGDGEAIALDNNAGSFALPSLSAVAAATPTTVAVTVPLMARQFEREVPLDRYYVGHWIQVADGPGIGQVRKIIAYATDPSTHRTTFTIAPDWDVAPVQGKSRIAVGPEFWQVYILDNVIDHRKPPCGKTNRSRPDGGAIVVWAQTADSVIEGNHQFDSDGILVQQSYQPPDKLCPDCAMQSIFQSFLSIRDNRIEGKYDWDSNCSSSGIIAGVAAAPWNDTPPPTLGFGVSISHNKIMHADAAGGGAIAVVKTWYDGPEPRRWPLSENLLIDHNAIADIGGRPAIPACGDKHPRVGIAFPADRIAWHTVLYANSCANVAIPIGSGSQGAVRVCPSSVSPSCECR